MATKKPPVEELDELIGRCAGIDVGHAELVVCARFPDEKGRRTKQVATFGATTPDLLALSEWLARLGVTDVAMESTGALAELARGKLGAKLPVLKKALTGRFGEHHAFLLERMLAHVDDLEADIASLTEHIGAATRPLEGQRLLLESIPGVGRHTTEVILAEIGTDKAVFPTSGHLASWAGMCPGRREPAGKRGSAETPKGSKWLRTSLIESARRAARTKGTYLAERYIQICRRQGDKKAIVAVAHEILLAAHHCLATGEFYDDPGPHVLRSSSTEHVKRRALARLRSIG